MVSGIAHAAALAKKTGAKVVPVYFEGRNSVPFQGAGLVHPRRIYSCHAINE